VFIIPVVRDLPIRHRSWVVYTLIVVNCAVFTITSAFLSTDAVADRFGFIPARHELTTVFTSMFLHANLLHILGNMILFWLFGESVEEALGHVATALSYVFCGIVATAVYSCLDADSTIPGIGASGAISGVVGLYAVLFPRARMDLEVYLWRFHVRTLRTNSVGAVGAWLGEQALLAVATRSARVQVGVAFSAHVGGLLAGLGLGWFLARSGLSSHYRRMSAEKASRFMVCPSCQRKGPRQPAGRYRCHRCRCRLQVDELGNVGLVAPTEVQSSSWPILILIAVLACTAIGWAARSYYNFFTH
jgi:membrane associated rhomboid family serine protease